MMDIRNIWQKMARLGKSRDVALVLSGGGARGLAHIGAIASLKAHGYRITSVAGTSMGALVGGIYAAGKLPEIERIVTSLTRRQILRLIDISPGLDHIATGQRLMELLHGLIGDQAIEELPIPFCCSASDMVSGKEIVFRTGPLGEAIRASIAIPGIFKPAVDGSHVFVDGSVHNVLPLDRVARRGRDRLVAVNVNAPDAKPCKAYPAKDDAKGEAERSLWRRMPLFRAEHTANYMDVLLRVAKLTVQNNTRMALRLTTPDILVEMPADAFGIFDFDKAAEIIAYGRREMDAALRGDAPRPQGAERITACP